MWSCDQSLVAFLWEKLLWPQFCKVLTRKTFFWERCSWFKFSNLELGLGMALNFYTSVAKRLKLQMKKFWGLISTFVEVTGEKLFGSIFLPPPSLIGLIGFSASKLMIEVHAWMLWNSSTYSYVEITTCPEDFSTYPQTGYICN